MRFPNKLTVIFLRREDGFPRSHGHKSTCTTQPLPLQKSLGLKKLSQTAQASVQVDFWSRGSAEGFYPLKFQA
jgi:hypothetical protein